MRYLALGDSYTVGEGVAESERWPVQLARLLRLRGVDVQLPEIVARTGWTTDELSAGIDAAGCHGPYDLVSLLIGVNDQYRGRTADAYRPAFRALLDRAIAFSGERAGRVVVLSIPDWSVTPFAEGRERARIAHEIEAFNFVNRAEAEAAGSRYVDIVPSSRRAASDAALLVADGLHPSGAMYREWAERVLPDAVAALSG